MHAAEMSSRIQRVQGTVLSWDSQACQYPSLGPPGISYFAGHIPGHDEPVHCYLWRNETGQLLGIANFYSVDFPPLEQAGNIFLLVHPCHRGRHIASELVQHVETAEGVTINWCQQRFSREGERFMRSYVRNHGGTAPD